MKLYEVLAMIDSASLEVPLYVDAKGEINCEPLSVYKVTLRFMAEESTSVTVPISSPLLIPWYDCKVISISPNMVQDSMDVWLDYCGYVKKKWKSKIIWEDKENE